MKIRYLSRISIFKSKEAYVILKPYLILHRFKNPHTGFFGNLRLCKPRIIVLKRGTRMFSLKYFSYLDPLRSQYSFRTHVPIFYVARKSIQFFFYWLQAINSSGPWAINETRFLYRLRAAE